jgi:transposase
LKDDSSCLKELAMAHGRYDLTEFEWKTIQPLLPNKPRGVPRVDDRRVLNGIFYHLRSGSPWADLPERYGPYTTVYNRFNRWRKAGIWDKLMDAIIAAHGGKVQMIDSTSVRVHQQAAAQKNRVEMLVSVVAGED